MTTEERLLRLEVMVLQLVGIVTGAAERDGVPKEVAFSAIVANSIQLAAELNCLKDVPPAHN